MGVNWEIPEGRPVGRGNRGPDDANDQARPLFSGYNFSEMSLGYQLRRRMKTINPSRRGLQTPAPGPPPFA